jgi:hypothetical protein
VSADVGPVVHKIDEMMATRWDEAGHRAPWGWRVIYTCTWAARELRDQTAAWDAWDAHRRRAILRASLRPQ